MKPISLLRVEFHTKEARGGEEVLAISIEFISKKIRGQVGGLAPRELGAWGQACDFAIRDAYS